MHGDKDCHHDYCQIAGSRYSYDELLSALDENERRVIEIKGVRSDRKKLLDENERLREALRRIVDIDVRFIQQRANEALKSPVEEKG